MEQQINQFDTKSGDKDAAALALITKISEGLIPKQMPQEEPMEQPQEMPQEPQEPQISPEEIESMVDDKMKEAMSGMEEMIDKKIGELKKSIESALEDEED